MFEKEAEEEINKEHWNYSIFKDLAQEYWQKGAEFGYNKAKEWHYVKDGDLPKEKKEYLVYKIDGYGCKSIQVMQFNNQHCWCANCQNEIIAWKEIELPNI